MFPNSTIMVLSSHTQTDRQFEFSSVFFVRGVPKKLFDIFGSPQSASSYQVSDLCTNRYSHQCSIRMPHKKGFCSSLLAIIDTVLQTTRSQDLEPVIW